MIRAVVFDMDGLMFNTEDVYTVVGCELLRRRGLEFTSELKDAMMGLQPRPGFEVAKHIPDALLWGIYLDRLLKPHVERSLSGGGVPRTH